MSTNKEKIVKFKYHITRYQEIKGMEGPQRDNQFLLKYVKPSVYNAKKFYLQIERLRATLSPFSPNWCGF